MAEFYEDEELEENEEFYDDEDFYDDDDIDEILEEYRRRRLIESLIGPVISTVFHVALIVILAIFITGKIHEPKTEIEVTMEEIEEVEIEEPPIEEPDPELEETETTDPVLTTVAVENVETDDAALEDTNDETPSTDDNMQDEAVSDVIVSPSAFASPSVYGGRSAAGRASAVAKFGGTKAGQDKLMKALWWLAKVQKPDGSWGSHYKPAFTGLALLTFLAHGETPTSKHFGKTVKKAMMWLSNDPMNYRGAYDGYSHAIKAYALAEAYAMTGISVLEGPMNEAIRIVIDGQQDGGCYNYGYSKDQKRQDLSFAGWNYQALKAAYGAGCEEPGLNDAIYKAIEWLKKNSSGSNQFPYSAANNTTSTRLSRFTMRSVGVLCLQLFGEGGAACINDDIMAISKEDFAKLNWDNPPRESLYGWYYGTQAMFQAGGGKWRSWNKRFQREIGDAQHKEGYWVYPGKFHGPKGVDDTTMKVYATTLCALMLTVYYRYLPSTKGAIGDKAAKKKEKAPVEEEELDLLE